jgi:hypothetical protein
MAIVTKIPPNLFYKVKLTRQEIVEENILEYYFFNGFKGFDSIEDLSFGK